jgi:hypothetical protein
MTLPSLHPFNPLLGALRVNTERMKTTCSANHPIPAFYVFGGLVGDKNANISIFVPLIRLNVRFSNRPFRVKRFQTIHHCSVEVTRGLVLLFGIGTKALVWGFFSQEV